MNQRDPVIEIRDLSVIIDGQAILEDVTLTVRKGDFYAIIGPNGAGKTTLIRSILGLIPVTRGEILLFSKPVSTENRSRIGYVPQYHSFDFNFPITVKEMVLTGRLGRKPGIIRRYCKEDLVAAENALMRLSASHLSDRPVGELSGGERQRVLISRALVGEPEILILDEPTVYVDTPTEEQFYMLLASLSHTVTILIITHDIGVVSQHVNHVACLNQRLFQHDTDHLTPDMLAQTYGCPVDIITHGEIPHRVLKKHSERP